MKKKNKQQILVTLGSLIVGVGTKSLVSYLWTKMRGNKPPDNPAHSDVRMGEALSWTITLAIVTGLVRTFYRKKITEKFALDV